MKLITILLLTLAIYATHPLHAQTTPSLPAPDSPTALGWFLLVLAGAALALNQILGIVRHFRTDPPNHTLYATKTDLAKLETDLDARIAGMSTASAQSREKVYNLLNDLRDAIARLETTATDQTRQLNRLDGKLDATADRSTRALSTAESATTTANQALAQANAARHHTP